MKLNLNRLVWLATFAFGASPCVVQLGAAEPNSDIVGQHLFAPELLIQHRVDLKLTDKQVDSIRQRVEGAGAKMQKQQVKLVEANQKLSKLLASEQVDQEAALAELDAILAIEKEAKRAHLKLMIQNRNELSAEQRQIANKLKTQPQVDLETRLKAKLARIEREVQRRANNGQPPQEIIGQMQNFGQLMENGQVVEAETFLDRMLKSLNLNDADDAKADPNSDAQRKPTREKRIAKQLPQLSRDAVAREIGTLNKEDVAWRKIEWKTCLLDGLKASREQRKPIMLWVFIDRPIDDERC